MACERHTVVYTCVRENSLEGVFTVAGMSNFMFYFKQVQSRGHDMLATAAVICNLNNLPVKCAGVEYTGSRIPLDTPRWTAQGIKIYGL